MKQLNRPGPSNVKRAKLQGLFISQSAEWRTPKALYDILDVEFHFDFDPCPLGATDDGLSTLFTSWAGKRVFCNPPYGPGIRQWLERGPEADIAVFLLPVRTDNHWFHEICLPLASEIRFIRGRLKFGESKQQAPFPSMLVIFQRERCFPCHDRDHEHCLGRLVCHCECEQALMVLRRIKDEPIGDE